MLCATISMPVMILLRRLIHGLACACPMLLWAEVPHGYYRFPAIHGDTVVFTAEGDLWRVPVTGGVAQRLTTHPGQETRAAFSPDGSTLAFTAEYEGPREVYAMPLAGGVPTRYTFDGAGSSTVGWTPKGQVLFSTRGASTLPNEQLVRLDPQSGEREVLPLAQASEGGYDESGGTLYFTRLPFQGSSTKRYQGGTVQNLWRYTAGQAEASPLTTDFKGTSKNAMWWQGRLFFLSDRDGVMNLWAMTPEGTDLKQLTRHRDYEVKSASLHAGRIVYQQGADLHLFDLASGVDRLIPITLASDFDQLRERWVKKPMDFLTSAHLSPNGDRVALTARGQVFVAPVEQGRFVEVPRSSGVRYRHARFFPDGKSLFALSDVSGELEFCKLPANGIGQPAALTSDGKVFRFEGVMSPDGKWLAWQDKNQQLWALKLGQKTPQLVATSVMRDFGDFVWSPDSQWLAYVQTGTNTYKQIHLYRASDQTRATVTSDRVDSFSPAWSPDGNWLYFLSDRALRSLVASPWGPRQPEPFFTETTKIYLVALTPGLRSPFRPKDELVAPEPLAKKEPAAAAKTAAKSAEPAKGATQLAEKEKPKSGSDTNKAGLKVTIELAGLATRVEEVPVPPGNYDDLIVTAKHLLWTASDLSFEPKQHLRQLEITNTDAKPKTLVDDLRSFELSHDGKKLLLRKGDAFYVIAADTAAPAKLEDKQVKLDGWSFALTPREEWRQIFVESWRMLRDYFYDRNLHAVDWPAVREKYLPLVDRVNDRAELNDVIAEMVGELSALHIFVRYGDQREGPDQIKPSSLGARLVPDRAAGGWRVEHVYRTDPDYPDKLAPLAQPGVNVKAGEVILSINGVSAAGPGDPDKLLRGQAGKQVLLAVKSPADQQTRQVIVRPISPEQAADLRYDEWEYTRRLAAEESSKGQVGYVHLRAMGAGNIAEWAREFYPVFQRPGLIIDVRHNRGGNIDSWILGRLLRQAWFYWQPRVGEPTWNMQYAFRGHVVVLCNEFTASDGEAFSEGFKRLGLGKVIGTRTWGGEIWLSAQRWLVDSGMATAAEIGVYGPEGAWLIEGHGVEPDLVVDNLPHATFGGRDAQLEAAVKHLQDFIARDPRPVPPTPKYPDKSFK
jgi:tricorn protease